MSKQDIEKRLGFAAQGVKETTRTSVKAKFGGHDAFVVTQNYNGSATGTIKGFDSLQQVQAYIKERRAAIAAKATPEEAKTVSWTIYKTIDEAGNSQSVGTVKFARPGAKAKMAAIDAGMMDGSGNKVVIRMADGSRATAQYNRGTGKWSLEGHADIPAFAKVRDLVTHLNKQGMSRPGVKTSFSNGATTNAFLSKIDAATRNKILTSIAKHYGISASQAMAEVTDADAESLLDYMTEPERSATSVLLKRHGFSRAGAKAAMAKPLRKAEPYEALYYKWFNGIQVSIMDMTKIKNDINAIIASGANPDVEMPKLVKKYASSGFSRLGAKANFAADAREVGNEILRQLGGGRFMSMVGGKNAMYGMFGGKPGLQVSIGKGAEGGINRVIITLDPATDTYRMEFWKIAKGGMSTQKVSEASMVYADDLQRVFTNRTKFYTSMSRPGVKAKFATEVGRKGNKSAMISRDATGTWYAYVVQRIETGIGKDEDMLGTMRAYSTEDRAKRAAIKALDTSGFSRPTVKAKA
jgi:hypothetical protein